MPVAETAHINAVLGHRNWHAGVAAEAIDQCERVRDVRNRDVLATQVERIDHAPGVGGDARPTVRHVQSPLARPWRLSRNVVPTQATHAPGEMLGLPASPAPRWHPGVTRAPHVRATVAPPPPRPPRPRPLA